MSAARRRDVAELAAYFQDWKEVTVISTAIMAAGYYPTTTQRTPVNRPIGGKA